MAAAPRALPETVMTQLEREENLARFTDPAGRLLARILMGTGLRVGDGCKLALDCIVRDGQDAPYLRYVNHKMRRDAFVPVDADAGRGDRGPAAGGDGAIPAGRMPAAAGDPQPGREAAVQPCHASAAS